MTGDAFRGVKDMSGVRNLAFCAPLSFHSAEFHSLFLLPFPWLALFDAFTNTHSLSHFSLSYSLSSHACRALTRLWVFPVTPALSCSPPLSFCRLTFPQTSLHLVQYARSSLLFFPTIPVPFSSFGSLFQQQPKGISHSFWNPVIISWFSLFFSLDPVRDGRHFIVLKVMCAIKQFVHSNKHNEDSVFRLDQLAVLNHCGNHCSFRNECKSDSTVKSSFWGSGLRDGYFEKAIMMQFDGTLLTKWTPLPTILKSISLLKIPTTRNHTDRILCHIRTIFFLHHCVFSHRLKVCPCDTTGCEHQWRPRLSYNIS